MDIEKNAEAAQKSIKRTRMITWIILGAAAALAVFIYVKGLPPPAHKYDALAKCIANTSTTFYGAFWCPHCRAQKNTFGDASQYLPYTECSTPDGKGELQVCKDAGVEHYPTWVFKDGSRLVGEQTVDTLAAKTGCSLPTST